MATSPALNAGAALGAAALVVSGASLFATHAPALSKVRESHEGTQVADNLRVAELAAAAVVVLAGGVAAVTVREWWPMALAVATVGCAVGVYEVTLRSRPAV